MPRAMVVDDRNPDYLRSGLKDRGYSVTCSNSTQQALNVLRKKTHDLVISDIESHNGYDGTLFARDARTILGRKPKIYLWSGHFLNPSRDDSELIDNAVYTLYGEGVIDGFAPKVHGNSKDNIMLDLVDSTLFLIFARQYGIPPFGEIDKNTLNWLIELEILRKYGLNISFGDRPQVTIPPILVPAYFQYILPHNI